MRSAAPAQLLCSRWNCGWVRTREEDAPGLEGPACAASGEAGLWGDRMSGGVLKPAKSPSLSVAPRGVLSAGGAVDGLQQLPRASQPGLPEAQTKSISRCRLSQMFSASLIDTAACHAGTCWTVARCSTSETHGCWRTAGNQM